MIILHTIKGQEFAINGGLIERVEQDNETHVTLATGTSYLVREPLIEVVRLHRQDRAKVRVLATELVRYEEEDGDDGVDPQSLSTIVQFPGSESNTHGRRQS
ncbi:MAG TPA: flagellar FlbD family protein [Acidimicrobiales bacterium]|nr:flagellar FlbD family protein [Acidimicrobiales bacterium]